MSGMQHSTYTPNNAFSRWFDERLPLPRLVYDSFVAYPVPRNLNYAYTFGGILSIMLVAQIAHRHRARHALCRRHRRSPSIPSRRSCAT